MSNTSDTQGNHQPPRFYTVKEAARILRTSSMTLYRSIAAHEFPAVRVRNRIVVPARAIDEMEAAALETHSVVNAAEWADATKTNSV